MDARTWLISSLLITGTLQVSPGSSSVDMCVYFGASLEDTQMQSVNQEHISPKSCAAACAGQKECFGVTDDKKAGMCKFHLGEEEDRCLPFGSTQSGQRLFLKTYSNKPCKSVRGLIHANYVYLHKTFDGIKLKAYAKYMCSGLWCDSIQVHIHIGKVNTSQTGDPC